MHTQTTNDDVERNASEGATSEVPWWRRGVVYQVYPRSFADANGDGTGDVEGIRTKLGYLAELGVDAIWISPWYPSPLNDGGYDVSDYRDIDPRFGSLGDAERLLADAARHDIKVIVDLVPNHTSSQHRWFRAATATPPGSPERARYIFRPGRDGGAQPPNNWTSVFGGPAWTRLNDDPDDGEWYLHLFDSTQPDLDWTNPDVLDEFDEIFRFWLERGVDGFRVDVAHGMVKDQALPDLDNASVELLEAMRALDHPYWDRDGVHDIIRRWRTVLDEHQAATGRDVMMVAEAWVHPTRLPLYLRADEYHQSFNFDFLETPWSIDEVRAAIDRGISAAVDVGSTPTWTLSNHDVMRHATRLGLPLGTNWRTWPVTGPADALDAERGLRRARAATLLLLALPGSTYIFQGEELGLPEVWDLPDEVLDDPVWENSGHQQRGRDGCRVPIPWAADGPSFGFGDGDAWLPQPRVYGELAADRQADDATSTFTMYRRALAIRDDVFVGDEALTWREGDGSALAFERGSGVVCVVNFGDDAVDLPDGEVLISSASLVDGRLPGDSTAWLRPLSV